MDLEFPISEDLTGPDAAIAESDVAARFEAMKMRLQNTVREITVVTPGSSHAFEVLDYTLAKRSIQAMDDIVDAFMQTRSR